jgi:transcriptional regulator
MLVEREKIDACEWGSIECESTVIAVLRMRFNDGVGQAEVARRLGVTRSLVCQIEKKHKDIIRLALIEKIMKVA